MCDVAFAKCIVPAATLANATPFACSGVTVVLLLMVILTPIKKNHHPYYQLLVYTCQDQNHIQELNHLIC